MNEERKFRKPEHDPKVFSRTLAKAAAETMTDAERMHRHRKYELLPRALDEIKGLRKSLAKHEAVVTARQHAHLRNERKYTQPERTAHQEQMAVIEADLMLAQKSAEKIKADVDGFETGRVKETYDAAWNEIRGAHRRGTAACRDLFRVARLLMKAYDAAQEQSSLFALASRHMSRARLEILRGGGELGEEPTLHYPLSPQSFVAWLSQQLPSRDRMPEGKWLTVFPHAYECIRAEPPLALEETGLDPDDTIPRECLLQEEDDADARIEQRLARQARAESVKHRAARRVAKKRGRPRKTADQGKAVINKPAADHPWRPKRRAAKPKKSSRARARAA